MRRDTYHDYVTAQEVVDAPNVREAQRRFALRQLALKDRSGAANCSSGILYYHRDPYWMVHSLEVRFDSRAWTGLP